MSHPRNPSGHKARKRFGQNFLVDQGIINLIVRAISPKGNDALVEIGPGQGALTAPLLEKHPQLDVIELDRDLVPVLLAQFAKYKDFKIHQCDALNFNYAELAEARGEKLRVVGNLPYNISTPLIFKLLEFKGLIGDMHFMLQKEVVDRLAAGPGDKNYGRLSIMTQYHCETEKLFEVPPTSFDPPPKVQSAIVRLTPYETQPHIAKNTVVFDKLVKTAFAQRRKTLRNGLKNMVSDEQAEQMGLDLKLRAENISLAQYVKYSNFLVKSEQTL